MNATFALQIPNPQDIGSSNSSRIWPIWKNSISSQIIFNPISQKLRNTIWHKARKWDQRTRTRGKHGGIVGRSALAVLNALLWDFLNMKSGRLDPTVATISRAASLSERATHTALQRLKSLRILNWMRRCEGSHDADGKFMLRQRSNAYKPQAPNVWLGHRSSEPPPPDRGSLGYPESVDDAIDAAVNGVLAGDRVQLRQALHSDPTDPLAAALAALGAAVGAI